jgi:hypothetical protein
MGREQLKKASSEKDHQCMVAWPPAGAMRPQRKLVPSAMALYGISAERVLELLPVGERRAVHLGAGRLDPLEGAASAVVMSAQTRRWRPWRIVVAPRTR